MKNSLLCTFFLNLFFVLSGFSQGNKHALIVAISQYPSTSGWVTLSSDKDAFLIKNMLLENGFLPQNIQEVYNEKATKEGITESLKLLLNRVQEGDIVYFHFSGHGQQIKDNNGDEIDDLDESIVPYDAPSRISYNLYQGQQHLLDDELGIFIKSLSEKVGKGQIILCFDSCYSGTLSRDIKTATTRGGYAAILPDGYAFEKDVSSEKVIDFSDHITNNNTIIFSAASAHEENSQTFDDVGNEIGSLSYAIHKTFPLATQYGIRYDEWFSKISLVMRQKVARQHPQVSGNTAMNVFTTTANDYQPSYSILKVKNDTIIIDAGSLSNVSLKSKLYIINAVNKIDTLFRGHIIKSEPFFSIAKLDKSFTKSDSIFFSIYIEKQWEENLKLKILATDTVVQKVLREHPLNDKLWGLTTEHNLADVNISFKNDTLNLLNYRNKLKYNFTISSTDSLIAFIIKLSRGLLVEKISEVQSEEYQLSIALVPTQPNTMPPKDNSFNINDEVQLIIKNVGKKPCYFSILNVTWEGDIVCIYPATDISANEYFLYPNQVFKSEKFIISPPKGVELLKAFASSLPINFTATLANKVLDKRGDPSPLEVLFNSVYSGQRAVNILNKKYIDGSIINYYFDIK